MFTMNGYYGVYMPNHPRVYQNGVVYEHFIKAEEKLGRELLPTEVVHHIDHNKTNNSYDNLLIFASSVDHARFHATDENLSYLIQLDNGSYICPEENVSHLFNLKPVHSDYCPGCGRRNHGKQVYCRDCAKKYHTRSQAKLEREELKNLIRTLPFTVIGQQCGVTDNAVRKWCDSYNLPRTKKEIKTYTDEEWANI